MGEFFKRTRSRRNQKCLARLCTAPCSGWRRDMKMGTYLFLACGFFQRIIVLYNGLAFSFSWKLSGPENIIPDVFSDIWILIFPYPAIFLHNHRSMSLLWEATPEIWSLEGRNRRNSRMTSWWSTGVSTKESTKSIYTYIRLCQRDK